MTDRNWRAYVHYLECKAVGHFPNDPIVRRNAVTIMLVIDYCERMANRQSAASALGTLLGGLQRR